MLVADRPVLTVVVFTHAGLGVVGQGEGCDLAVAPRVAVATHTFVAVDAVLAPRPVLANVGRTLVYVGRTVLATEAWPAVTPGARNRNY